MGHFYEAKVKRANAEVGDEVTGCQEGTADGRKSCSGSWKVRAQVGFVSLGSTGACASPPRGTSWQSARLIGPGFPEADSSTLS